MTFRLAQWRAASRNWLTATRIVLVYAEFSLVWILSSGYLLIVSVKDPALGHLIEVSKGILFVTVTSGLLFVLLKS